MEIFIFQIFNNGEIELPKSIKLIQFFYDSEEFPWQTEEDGWFVKIYETLNTNKMIKIDNPKENEEKNSSLEKQKVTSNSITLGQAETLYVEF